MNNFTVCSLYTPDYGDVIYNLKNDCERLGYNYHFYEVPAGDYLEICKLKINYWKESIENFETVLWLDADARILKKIPQKWLNGVSLARYNYNNKSILRRSKQLGSDNLLKLYKQLEESQNIITHTTKDSKETTEIVLKYFLGGFGIINKTMLPIIDKTLEYVDNFWEDEGVFNYVCGKHPELLPDHLEIPYYARWHLSTQLKMKIEEIPHIVKGYTENNKAIIVFDETHNWNRTREVTYHVPIFNPSGRNIFESKANDLKYLQKKLYLMYYPNSFDVAIETTIEHMMHNYTDTKHLDRIYTKFCRLFKIDKEEWYIISNVKNKDRIYDVFYSNFWTFNLTTKEITPPAKQFELVTPMDISFDKDLLLNEMQSIKFKPFDSVPSTVLDSWYNKPDTWLIGHVVNLQGPMKPIEGEIGRLVKVLEEKTGSNDIRPRFYKQEKNSCIPPHKDYHTECSVNFMLSKDHTPVKFFCGKPQAYGKTNVILLNTQKEHMVPEYPKERIILKFSIFDKTYDEVRKCLFP